VAFNWKITAIGIGGLVVAGYLFWGRKKLKQPMIKPPGDEMVTTTVVVSDAATTPTGVIIDEPTTAPVLPPPFVIHDRYAGRLEWKNIGTTSSPLWEIWSLKNDDKVSRIHWGAIRAGMPIFI
jgi:hypothetical protein